MSHTESSGEYRVVFRVRVAAGPNERVRTWTCYGSKKDFDKSWSGLAEKGYEIVAEGVATDQEAVQLCTPSTQTDHEPPVLGSSIP